MCTTVCIDSNAQTYLVEAMTYGGVPTSSLAKEKIALLRIYLYRKDILYISSTVEHEFQKIKDDERKKHHQGIADVLLGEIPQADKILVKSRTTEYLKTHKSVNDCRILAESELGGGKAFLTYDQTFLKKLRGHTHGIELFSPSEFWVNLAIPKGTKPITSPHPSNPLSNETWWVW